MRQLRILVIVFMLVTVNMYSQVTVIENGNVGVGTEDPSAKLEIHNPDDNLITPLSIINDDGDLSYSLGHNSVGDPNMLLTRGTNSYIRFSDLGGASTDATNQILVRNPSAAIRLESHVGSSSYNTVLRNNYNAVERFYLKNGSWQVFGHVYQQITADDLSQKNS